MSYRVIEPSDLEALGRITSPDRVLAANQISEDYGHDELCGIFHLPEALVRPISTQEVSGILAYCNEKRVPVVVRGSGTGLVGGAVAVQGGVLIETSQMNHILEIDEQNLTVTVEPGVLLLELSAYCEAHGFFYPPDPGEKSATIGGNISTNAGGMRAVKYGVTRDYVRGLTVVLPSGEVMELAGKTAKNSSGYSLKDLLIGSEGTLGVITQAVLRLLPLPTASVSLLVPFDCSEQALALVPELARERLTPTAIEFFTRDAILFAEDFLHKRFPDTGSMCYLLLTFDGFSEQSVTAEYQVAAQLCLAQGANDVLIVDTNERKDAVWNTRGAFLEAIKASTSEMDECDVVVPRSCMPLLLRTVQDISPSLGVRIPCFGHAGDGNLHIYLCRNALNSKQWDFILTQAFEQLYSQAAYLGGAVSGEHGIGYAKRSYLKKSLGERQISLMQGIKAVFDPNGILNPQKVC